MLKVSFRKTYIRDSDKIFPGKPILSFSTEVWPLFSSHPHETSVKKKLECSFFCHLTQHSEEQRGHEHSSCVRTTHGLERPPFTALSLNMVPASSRGTCWPPVGTWTGKLARMEGNTCQLRWSLPLVVQQHQAWEKSKRGPERGNETTKSWLFLHLTLASHPTCKRLIKSVCKLHLWG